MRIDVHNHAIPERVLDLLRRDRAYGVELAGDRWSGGVHTRFDVTPSFRDPAAKLAELEANGLDAAIVSAAPPLFYYHLDLAAGEAMATAVNRGLAEFCADAPDRLGWLATLPLQDPDRAAAMLEGAASAGCVGFEVGTAVVDRRLDEAEFEPFWAVAAAVGLPVTLHPVHAQTGPPGMEPYYLENVIGFPFETTLAIERLICAGVLDRHPELRLVLVHAGGYFPFQAGRLRHACAVRPELADSPSDPWAYLDRLHFDVVAHDTAALGFVIERVGAERVVMGTDLPFDMALREPVTALLGATDERTLAAIAERNPATLYGWESAVGVGTGAGDGS